MNNPSRREFLKSTFSTVCTAGLSGGLAESLAAAPGISLFSAANAAPLPAPLAIKKGLVYDMLPHTLSHADQALLDREWCGERRGVGCGPQQISASIPS